MLKDPKFVLETAMRAPVLVSLQLTNIFDNDVAQSEHHCTCFFLQGVTERPHFCRE